MKLATFKSGGQEKIGIVHSGDTLLFDLAAGADRNGSANPSFASMLALIDAGESALEQAAKMFEKHGNYQQAAEFFLKVNNYDKAAINFEKSVNNFVAGKLYFRMNKMNKSLQLLQKVQKTEGQYFEACRLIGEILAQNGYLDLAIRKYLEVVQSAGLSQCPSVRVAIIRGGGMPPALHRCVHEIRVDSAFQKRKCTGVPKR